jgi:hypothetical protein
MTRSSWLTRRRTGGIDAKNSSCRNTGILMLRFLTEDLAKDLDSVLDILLRALVRWSGPLL